MEYNIGDSDDDDAVDEAMEYLKKMPLDHILRPLFLTVLMPINNKKSRSLLFKLLDSDHPSAAEIKEQPRIK